MGLSGPPVGRRTVLRWVLVRLFGARAVLALVVSGPLAAACGEIREVPVGESTGSGTTESGGAASSTSGMGGSTCGVECDDHGSSGASTSASSGSDATGGGAGPDPICASPLQVIPDAPAPGAMAAIEVDDLGPVLDLDVAMRIEHEFIGDLRVELVHDGTSIVLIDQPEGGGCAGANIEVALDDEEAGPVACGDAVPSIGGRATPQEALAAFDTAATAGTWTLVVTDLRPEVAGTLTSWCLDFGDGP